MNSTNTTFKTIVTMPYFVAVGQTVCTWIRGSEQIWETLGPVTLGYGGG